MSADADDHALLQQLRSVLVPFGFSLTERGLPQRRPTGDAVLALSESKDDIGAVVNV